MTPRRMGWPRLPVWRRRRPSRDAATGVLDEARGVRAMTWIIGIMMFLTVLAAASGLATRAAAAALAHDLAGRLTVQVVAAEPVARDRQAARALAALRASSDVVRATPVSREELARLLEPWLGTGGADAELPMPAMIEADLRDASDAATARVSALVRRAAPDARVDRHESWMSPVSGVLSLVTWLAAALVLLMAGATAAVVVLAARAGLDSHRATIEVMHMLGSTDVQIARLFQRRIARDAAVGGVIGALSAALVAAFVGTRVAALGSELLGSAGLAVGDWTLLALLPLAFVVLAALAARMTITGALKRVL